MKVLLLGVKCAWGGTGARSPFKKCLGRALVVAVEGLQVGTGACESVVALGSGVQGA